MTRNDLFVTGLLLAAAAAVAVGAARNSGGAGEGAAESESKANQPPASRPADEKGRKMNRKTATFGAGCFWGVEATFRQIKGVTDAAVGYMGGKTERPTYQEVCADETGHAEVVWVEYDPAVVSYDKLLDVFWENHDPTTLNRQGPDHGSQYRSAIFFYDAEQEKAARASKEKLDKSGRFKRPIVTEITPAKPFWRAEEYHQRYLEKRGLSTCHVPSGN